MKNKTQNKKQNLKDYKGITLIALVVTIIVLLILAAISITAVFGENGLITKADKAKIRSNHTKVYEAIKLEEQTYQIYARTNQIQTNLISYLQEKQIINEENIINVEKLLGGTLPTGNGTGTKDIYKLEKLTESGETASTNTTETYTVVYYDTNEVRAELGNLSDIVRAQDNKRTIDSIYQIRNDIVLWKNKKAQLFVKEGDRSSPGWVNITEDIEPIAENVKEVYDCYYLTNDNKLYNVLDGNSLIAENMKEVYDEFYITNDNKLYNANDNSLIAENVKKFYDDYGCYITNEDKLYDAYDNSLIAENVKDVEKAISGWFLTNDNKLYAYGESNYILIAENVKDFGHGLYLTNDNKLYAYDGSNYSLVAENVKSFHNGYYLTNDNKLYFMGSLVAENVKEIYYTVDYYVFYLTSENKLYGYDGENNILIAENVDVKEVYDLENSLYYLTNDNKLYFMGSLVAENVKEIYYSVDYDVRYLTSDNKLYNANDNSLIAENVEEVDNDYYRTSDGAEYVYKNFSPPV